MAAVIGLLAVSLLATSLVATSVVQATEYTSLTRAGVQSQAAAEAGIAAARAGLLQGTCAAAGNRYASPVGEAPRYLATVWVPSGSSWMRGCPPGTATQVRILSTGYADDEGVAGVSGADVAHLEAVLSASSVPTEITATGPAIYAYNSQGFGGGGRLLTVPGSDASIMIKEGDVECTGGASGQADSVVNNGNLRVAAGCNITGNAYVSGRVTLPGGPSIGKNVVANAVTITGGSEIGGNVWVNQDVTLDGGPHIRGNVTAATVNFSNGTIHGNVQATGHINFNGGGPEIKGNVTAASLSASSSGVVRGNGWINGPVTVNWTTKFHKALNVRSLAMPGGMAPNADSWRYNRRDFFPAQDPTIVPGGLTASPYTTNSARPATPFVPDWINLAYDPADWTGFAVATVSNPNGSCSYAQVKAAVDGFSGQNGIVNAMGCRDGISIGSDHKVTLTSDIAIFAKAYDLGGGGGFGAGQVRRLWLLTPDLTAETGIPLPSCETGENSFKVTGGFTFASTLRVMMYTPCKIALGSSTTFTGQVFSGKAGIDGGAQITYTAVGLPGYNLDTGVRNSVTSTEADRTIVSFRNVESGN